LGCLHLHCEWKTALIIFIGKISQGVTDSLTHESVRMQRLLELLRDVIGICTPAHRVESRDVRWVVGPVSHSVAGGPL
jgi:hypothetical protein